MTGKRDKPGEMLSKMVRAHLHLIKAQDVFFLSVVKFQLLLISATETKLTYFLKNIPEYSFSMSF
jgi:hypothetical protein